MQTLVRNMAAKVAELTDMLKYPAEEASPAHYFAASADLLETAVLFDRGGMASLPIKDALTMRRCHLTPFDRQALSVVNNAYYQLPGAFDDMPGYFTSDIEVLSHWLNGLEISSHEATFGA